MHGLSFQVSQVGCQIWPSHQRRSCIIGGWKSGHVRHFHHRYKCVEVVRPWQACQLVPTWPRIGGSTSCLSCVSVSFVWEPLRLSYASIDPQRLALHEWSYESSTASPASEGHILAFFPHCVLGCCVRICWLIYIYIHIYIYIYIYIYPVRCAHNPPPCLLFLNFHYIIFKFFNGSVF